MKWENWKLMSKEQKEFYNLKFNDNLGVFLVSINMAILIFLYVVLKINEFYKPITVYDVLYSFGTYLIISFFIGVCFFIHLHQKNKFIKECIKK